jgi:predicted phosphoribosyltransferase
MDGYFADRRDAGRQLAARLLALPCGLRGREDVVVLGLPRGGVPVAAEVAAALEAPLDVLLVRKLGLPGQEELAMGAIGEDGVRVLNEDVIGQAFVPESALRRVEDAERAELERRSRLYRGDRPPTPLTGRTAVVVDDGIATGATARAACLIARARGAARVIMAAPVAPPEWSARFADAADTTVAVRTPSWFHSIGACYADFAQTPDATVTACLSGATTGAPPRSDESS